MEVFFDGCCEPMNPGGNGGYAFIVRKDGEILHQSYGFCGKGQDMTNNVAEYCGIIEAMKWLKENGHINGITFFGDSMLVIQQVSKKWKIKRGAYLPKAIEAIQLSSHFKGCQFEWIPREENIEADVLSKIGAKQAR